MHENGTAANLEAEYTRVMFPSGTGPPISGKRRRTPWRAHPERNVPDQARGLCVLRHRLQADGRGQGRAVCRAGRAGDRNMKPSSLSEPSSAPSIWRRPARRAASATIWGLDTISAGGTIAWAMEAFEKGDLTAEDTDGVPLNWGDMETVINMVLPKIAEREGKLGQLLADGSVAAAKRSEGVHEYTVHSKGLEAPMHDPRGGGHGLALTYAMSPAGRLPCGGPHAVRRNGSALLSGDRI